MRSWGEEKEFLEYIGSTLKIKRNNSQGKEERTNEKLVT